MALTDLSITVFAKNEKANLTPAKARAVRKLGKELADSYGRNGS